MSLASAKPQAKLVTADELLAMGDIGRCELIYGELVMMSPAGLEHGVVAMRIGRFIAEYVDAHELGVVPAAETGYLVERDPDLLRAADASYISKARLGGEMTSRPFPGVPDLAVEVVSPGESRREVAEKVNMWLAHGTTSVWVAYPATMTIAVHRLGIPAIVLHQDQSLENEPTLPGFCLQLSKVFKRP